MAAVYKHYHRI